VALTADLADEVLTRLGFSQRPDLDRSGLDTIYGAWCRGVPFDNLVKRIHLASRSAEPIPNGPPPAFFMSWLRDGTGGTCWPGSGALHALLATLGFDVRRGSAAMYDNFTGPVHTHGTTLVRFDGVDHWVDSSMLTNVALPLVAHDTTRHDDPVSPVRAEPVGDLWRIWWTNAIDGSEIGCLLLDDDVSGGHFLARYEWSRTMSPFNTAVYATRNTTDARITIAFGQRFERRADTIASAALGDDRDRVLVSEFGYSEAIVACLPADEASTTQE